MGNFQTNKFGVMEEDTNREEKLGVKNVWGGRGSETAFRVFPEATMTHPAPSPPHTAVTNDEVRSILTMR